MFSNGGVHVYYMIIHNVLCMCNNLILQTMFDYIRDGNPTRTCLETALAGCEDAKQG